MYYTDRLLGIVTYCLLFTLLRGYTALVNVAGFYKLDVCDITRMDANGPNRTRRSASQQLTLSVWYI